MKYPKKPKLKKFPKTPKSNNVETLKRYKSRVADIQKENDKKMAEYKKKVNAIDAEKKRIASLKEQARKMKQKKY